MDKRIISGIFVMILLVGLAYGSSHLTFNEDLEISLTTAEETDWNERGGLNLTQEFKKDYEKAYLDVFNNATYRFSKVLSVKSYTDECVSWNLTLNRIEGNQSFIKSSIVSEIKPLEFNGSFVSGECFSNPRINKTDSELLSELTILLEQKLKEIVSVEKERSERIPLNVISEGEVSLRKDER